MRGALPLVVVCLAGCLGGECEEVPEPPDSYWADRELIYYAYVELTGPLGDCMPPRGLGRRAPSYEAAFDLALEAAVPDCGSEWRRFVLGVDFREGEIPFPRFEYDGRGSGGPNVSGRLFEVHHLEDCAWASRETPAWYGSR